LRVSFDLRALVCDDLNLIIFKGEAFEATSAKLSVCFGALLALKFETIVSPRASLGVSPEHSAPGSAGSKPSRTTLELLKPL
jgi:hypothetical protein